MPRTITVDQALRMRFRAQRLDPAFRGVGASVDAAVADVGGIQAQEPAAATLAIRPRSDGLLASDIERARVRDRSIVRTWAMRGTLHLVASQDLGWLTALLGPMFIAAGRRRRAELGLDDETCRQGIRAVRDLLGNQGPLTRTELVEQLPARGIHLEGQARPYLLGRAALEGVICFGPDRGGEPSYVLLDDWVPRDRMVSLEHAPAELARRHLAAYGPATPDDLAAWSGLPLSVARAAWGQIERELVEVQVDGQPAWILSSCGSWLDGLGGRSPVVRLLAGFDTYLLGHRSRDGALEPKFAKRVNAGGGIIHPTLVVDGRVVGTWKSERRRTMVRVAARPFGSLERDVEEAVRAEVIDMGRFLEAPTALDVARWETASS